MSQKGGGAKDRRPPLYASMVIRISTQQHIETHRTTATDEFEWEVYHIALSYRVFGKHYTITLFAQVLIFFSVYRYQQR